MRSVTPKPESRVHWPGHGQEPCPVQTTRLAITRAGNRRNGLRTFYSPPQERRYAAVTAPAEEKARCRAGGSAPIIPSRSSSWSATGRAMDLRSIRVTLFSQHGPSAVRVPSVRSFHRRDVPPGVRNTSSVPLRHSRTLRPLPPNLFGMPRSMASSRQQPGAVNRPFNTATHHTRRKPAQRRYALSRPVLLKATGRARAPLNRCRAEARPDGVSNGRSSSRVHGPWHPSPAQAFGLVASGSTVGHDGTNAAAFSPPITVAPGMSHRRSPCPRGRGCLCPFPRAAGRPYQTPHLTPPAGAVRRQSAPHTSR